ncbi:MAG: hypothetical protein ACKV2Q_20140 [Planctomycetaceae bacterium]
MFTVVWSQSANNQLTDVWMKADSISRSVITRYVAELDQHLRANGDRIGESREEGIRVLTDGPLGVACRVSESDRLVTVVYVWFIPRRR